MYIRRNVPRGYARDEKGNLTMRNLTKSKIMKTNDNNENLAKSDFAKKKNISETGESLNYYP